MAVEGVIGPAWTQASVHEATARAPRQTESAALAFAKQLETAIANAPKSGGAAAADPALVEAAQAFEAYFLNYLLRGMRRTVPEGGLIAKGFSGEVYEEMLDQNLAETMAQAGGIGLAQMLLEQLGPAASLDKKA